MRAPARRLAAARFLLCLSVCAGAGVDCSYFRSENAAWTPSDSPLAERGPQVSQRFALERRFQLSVRVNNAFSPANRIALARAELALARIPGVRSVLGPGGLRTFVVDDKGRVDTSTPTFTADPALDEQQIQQLHHTVERRSDATGWFVSRDGAEIRFIVEADQLEPLRTQISAAILASGLTVRNGGAFLEMPVLPRPARDSTPYSAGWLLAAVLAVVSLFAVPALSAAQPVLSRALLAALVAGLATASLGVFAPVVPLRRYSITAGLAVVVWILVLAAILRQGSLRAPARPGRRLHVQGAIGIPCAVLVILLLAAWPRLRLETRVWQPSSLFFISVRGAVDQPIVMREVRRLTDFVRELPGVAEAWAIADGVEATPRPGQDRTGIPEDAAALGALLTRMDEDSAARLELSPDHQEALIAIRWDDAAGIDRLALLRRIEHYLDNEQRSILARVDLADVETPVPARGFARGILALDGSTRILRACARSGRNLDDEAMATCQRMMRQAALAPAADLPRLRAELEAVLVQFLERMGGAEGEVTLPGKPAPAVIVPTSLLRQRWVDAVVAEPWESGVADLADILAAATPGRRLSASVRGHLSELRSSLAEARRRNAGRLIVKELLGELDLPVDGALSGQVRDAVLEAMGPVAGVPVASPSASTFSIDSFVVGGAAQDSALSRAWLPRLWLGIAASGLLLAVVLLLTGGVSALGWWPVGLGPIAAAFAVPALGAVSIGIWSLVVAAGALAGGSAFAVVFAPAWVDE